MSHPFTVAEVASAYMDHVYKLHGNLMSIVSDRGPTFLSRFWQELFTLQGVIIHMSYVYNPQTNKQIEVVNRCLEGYLRCIAGSYP